MNIKYIAPFVLIFFAAAYSPASAHVPNMPQGFVEHQFDQPRKVVEVFLEAVDRGELLVFDQVLDRSMIVPFQVEYIYQLDSSIPQISIFSKLKQPIPIPYADGCEVRAVSAIMDNAGIIIEAVVHVWTGD